MVFCGIDIGATSTNAVVLDRDGSVLDAVTLPVPVDVMGGFEIRPYECFCWVMDSFAAKGLLGEEVACSVTAQGGSFVLVDDGFQPVCDTCSGSAPADDGIVRDLLATLGEAACYHLTGWSPHDRLAACKLKQMIKKCQLPDDTAYVAMMPDVIYAQLTGNLHTDITTAQVSGLADFQAGWWSRGILAWAGVSESLLPPIVPALEVIAKGVRTRWGRMTLVTGSHDRYAAMEAAGLEKDTSVMLSADTAWVLSGRTARPVFDDARFRIHPGRDLHPHCHGFIFPLEQVGTEFDRLLARLGLTQASLTGFGTSLEAVGVPQGPVETQHFASPSSGCVDPVLTQLGSDAATSVRRCMEWAGSVVAHSLETCGLVGRLERIVVTGEAMVNSLWPQLIADICDLTVEAAEYAQFTAYGAALHARHAVLGPMEPHRFPETAVVRTFVPRPSREYNVWYRQFQRPLLDAQSS